MLITLSVCELPQPFLALTIRRRITPKKPAPGSGCGCNCACLRTVFLPGALIFFGNCLSEYIDTLSAAQVKVEYEDFQ